jgi:hypothetical protein
MGFTHLSGPLNVTSVQSLSGAGAVNVTSDTTEVTTTGADALSLADGTEGQYKTITMVVDGGDGTLTPTNLLGASTITFNDVGDSVLLRFRSGTWTITAGNGVTIA